MNPGENASVEVDHVRLDASEKFDVVRPADPDYLPVTHGDRFGRILV